MKERIIFVGIHNKPGMEPLDSRTKSGKIIDEVIKGVQATINLECIKTNLFNCESIPMLPDARVKWKIEWMKSVKPATDLFIALGQDVKDHIPFGCRNVIYVPHPASRHIKREQYIQSLIEKIKDHAK